MLVELSEVLEEADSLFLLYSSFDEGNFEAERDPGLGMPVPLLGVGRPLLLLGTGTENAPLESFVVEALLLEEEASPPSLEDFLPVGGLLWPFLEATSVPDLLCFETPERGGIVALLAALPTVADDAAGDARLLGTDGTKEFDLLLLLLMSTLGGGTAPAPAREPAPEMALLTPSFFLLEVFLPSTLIANLGLLLQELAADAVAPSVGVVGGASLVPAPAGEPPPLAAVRSTFLSLDEVPDFDEPFPPFALSFELKNLNLSNIEFLLAAAVLAAVPEGAAAADVDRVGRVLVPLPAVEAQLVVLVALTRRPDDAGRPALALRLPGNGMPEVTEGEVDRERLGSRLLARGPLLLLPPDGEMK